MTKIMASFPPECDSRCTNFFALEIMHCLLVEVPPSNFQGPKYNMPVQLQTLSDSGLQGVMIQPIKNI